MTENADDHSKMSPNGIHPIVYNTKYSKMPIFYKFEENCRKNKIGELEHPNQKKIAMHIIYQYQFTQLFLVRAAKNFISLEK